MATVHGCTGIEKISLIQMPDDGEEEPEIALDGFEDPENDPSQALQNGLAMLPNKLMRERAIVGPGRWRTLRHHEDRIASLIHR